MIVRNKATRSAALSAQIMVLSLILSAPVAAAQQQVTVPPCNLDTASVSNKSGTYNADAQLFAAPPQGTTRTGMFVQCLTASCTFALNFSGGTASLTAAGNLVVNGQYGFFNGTSFGFMPQGAVRIIANASSAITAWACPQ